jgi:hypothetical protein
VRHSRRLAAAAATIVMACAASGDERDTGLIANPHTGELHFARLRYQDAGYRRGWGSWSVDFPEAEIHFTQGVSWLTRAQMGEPVILDLNSDSLFDYPWLYAVEVGYWFLDDAHAARLREYLLRGGFLMVDDFHGTRQWAVFMESLQRVFPDRQVVEIAEDDEVLHVLYDLDQRIQIPGIWTWLSGQTHEQDGYTPHWRGVYDDQGRLMVAINFNMDLGDAWEHADDPRYPEAMTGLAYRFAVNYVIYAMTH